MGSTKIVLRVIKTVFGFESNGFWFRKKAAFGVGKIGSGIRKNGVGGSTTGFVVGKKWVCLFGSYIREKKNCFRVLMNWFRSCKQKWFGLFTQPKLIFFSIPKPVLLNPKSFFLQSPNSFFPILQPWQAFSSGCCRYRYRCGQGSPLGPEINDVIPNFKLLSRLP